MAESTHKKGDPLRLRFTACRLFTQWGGPHRSHSPGYSTLISMQPSVSIGCHRSRYLDSLRDRSANQRRPITSHRTCRFFQGLLSLFGIRNKAWRQTLRNLAYVYVRSTRFLFYIIRNYPAGGVGERQLIFGFRDSGPLTSYRAGSLFTLSTYYVGKRLGTDIYQCGTHSPFFPLS